MKHYPNEVVEVWSGVLRVQRTRWRQKSLGYLPAVVVAVGDGEIYVAGVDTGTCLGHRWVSLRHVRSAYLSRGLDIERDGEDF